MRKQKRLTNHAGQPTHSRQTYMMKQYQNLVPCDFKEHLLPTKLYCLSIIDNCILYFFFCYPIVFTTNTETGKLALPSKFTILYWAYGRYFNTQDTIKLSLLFLSKYSYPCLSRIDEVYIKTRQVLNSTHYWYKNSWRA